MKKFIYALMIVVSLFTFASCKAEKQVQGKNDKSSEQQVEEKYIQKAELSEAEEQIAKLIGVNENQLIYDFQLDDKVKSVYFILYELKEGKWDISIGKSTQNFTDKSGRAALTFDNLPYGFRISLESENSSGSTKFSTEQPSNNSEMNRGLATLDDKTEIIYEKEIPLVIQVVTSGDSFSNYDLENFYTPEKFSGLEYEHVYATTVMFSEKTLSNLNTQSENEGLVSLVIDKYSDEEVIGSERYSGAKYRILNSNIKVIDNENNPLTWSYLKDAKTIDVHYLGGIKELSPALFNEISKIVITS